MESNPSRSNLKRPFFEDDGSDKPPAQKKVRFPKGKKARPGDEAVNRGRPEEAVGVGIGPTPLTDPRSAAKERAQRRSQITTELFSEETAGILNDVSAAEVSYKDYEDFVEDGIQIEPFNLNKEREEGYFDADGNFVEYANKNEVEDAWLDSVEVDTKYAGKGFAVTKDDDDVQDLSSDDVGKIKRRIADGCSSKQITPRIESKSFSVRTDNLSRGGAILITEKSRGKSSLISLEVDCVVWLRNQLGDALKGCEAQFFRQFKGDSFLFWVERHCNSKGWFLRLSKCTRGVVRSLVIPQGKNAIGWRTMEESLGSLLNLNGKKSSSDDGCDSGRSRSSTFSYRDAVKGSNEVQKDGRRSMGGASRNWNLTMVIERKQVHNSWKEIFGALPPSIGMAMVTSTDGRELTSTAIDEVSALQQDEGQSRSFPVGRTDKDGTRRRKDVCTKSGTAQKGGISALDWGQREKEGKGSAAPEEFSSLYRMEDFLDDFGVGKVAPIKAVFSGCELAFNSTGPKLEKTVQNKHGGSILGAGPLGPVPSLFLPSSKPSRHSDFGPGFFRPSAPPKNPPSASSFFSKYGNGAHTLRRNDPKYFGSFKAKEAAASTDFSDGDDDSCDTDEIDSELELLSDFGDGLDSFRDSVSKDLLRGDGSVLDFDDVDSSQQDAGEGLDITLCEDGMLEKLFGDLTPTPEMEANPDLKGEKEGELKIQLVDPGLSNSSSSVRPVGLKDKTGNNSVKFQTYGRRKESPSVPVKKDVKAKHSGILTKLGISVVPLKKTLIFGKNGGLASASKVLQALRRLKGTSNNKKEKMSAETKRVFDQLTEDATNLMDNGESNVYHEKKEMFEREAEGYESLARARREGTSPSAYQGKSVLSMEWGTSSDVTGPGVPSSILPETAVGTSNSNAPTAETTSNGADAFDIFAEDDEHVIAKPSSEGSTVVCGPNSDGVSSLPSNNLNAYSENGVLQNDYVFDESSGYYYSSSLGCYYDPSTGFYCSAASGLWYSFNAETGAYDEIHQAATSVN
ncbi:hypothetical protein Pyn_11880 [Prunus yedoensis var. nudiflora]|uniref:OCRE domain-containing protein n=1 Tax=Prunus yedoensis var. nudiflora TaxID=2094558 RepID=A0A314Z0H2_PRUYE|nr:hypothetical protein Pyn_11880 [Prunus yedoensis var. nudiflora]